MMHFIGREDTAAYAIQRQIEFRQNYEDIGVQVPMWQDIGVKAKELRTLIPSGKIGISVKVERLEVLADFLLEKVFGNLIDNSLRPGSGSGISHSLQCRPGRPAAPSSREGVHPSQVISASV